MTAINRRAFLALPLAACKAEPKPDPAVEFSRVYNAWIVTWNEAGDWRLHVTEISQWREVKKQWARLRGVVDRYYGVIRAR